MATPASDLSVDGHSPAGAPLPAGRARRPQTLLLTLLGRHVLHQPIAVSSGTFIAVLDRLDIASHAARSTLTRMVNRGHLVRYRQGRQAYFSLTPRTERVLEEGVPRIFGTSPVRDAGDDEWTLLSFSIPEEQRSHRHNLRVALGWRGFGLLRHGLWIAPGRVDMGEVVDQLDLHERIEVFVGQPAAPTDIRRVVADAWDLDEVRAGYERFIDRWRDGSPPGLRGPLARQVQLITEWRLLLLDDPRLPEDHLPAGWPAGTAHDLFQIHHAALTDAARAEFEQLLEAIHL